MDQKTKPVYLSKTFWANVIMALAFLLPKEHQLLAMSPDVQAFVFLLVNTILRIVSKDKVTLY